MTKIANYRPDVVRKIEDEGLENFEQPISIKNHPHETGQVSAAKVLYDENEIDRNLVALLNPKSYESEQFKILRTHIFFPLSGKIPRMIAVTSAVPGEGKSFVSTNLAVSIANDIDKSVLLVDCDLRKPSIHKMFGFKDDLPGLSEYLSRNMDLSSLLLHTKLNKLSILPAGSSVDNPSELLASEQMASMLRELSQERTDRLVILDTTPLNMTAEAVTLTRYVDGILVVVKQGYTLKEHLKDLIKIIDRDKIIGVVLNNVDMRSFTQYGNRQYAKKYY